MSRRPIFYDTETTGIDSKGDRVIEIALFDPERKATFEALVNPCCPIPLEATRVHNITNAMVADKPSFSEILPDLLTFCEGEVTLIAHNNDGFDILFLREEMARANHTFPTTWTFFDTLKWARRYRPDLPRHSLQYLREIYGIPPNNAHRALDDVIVLHRIYLLLVDDLTIEQAARLLNQTRQITHMPFGKHQGTPLAKLPPSYVAWLKESGTLDKPQNASLKESLEPLATVP